MVMKTRSKKSAVRIFNKVEAITLKNKTNLVVQGSHSN